MSSGPSVFRRALLFISDTPSASDRTQKAFCHHPGPLRARDPPALHACGSPVGDNIEISCPICVTALVPERPYAFHESITWWGVQKIASADLLGFVLLETSLFARLHRRCRS